MAKELLTRSQVPEELKWDLTLIYKEEKDLDRDIARLGTMADEIAEKYKGHLDTAANIDDCLTMMRHLLEIEVLVMTYCELAVSVDYYNSAMLDKQGQAGRAAASAHSKLSFVDGEIMEQPEHVLTEAIALATDNKNYLLDILRKKPHQLHPEAERVLASLSEAINTPYQLYGLTKLADMKFDNFEVNGESHPLGYAMFENNYQYEEDTAVRRTAFDAFSKKIREYENVTAGAYNANVQNDKTLATLRGFDSVFDFLLFPQKVTREMYDRQIDLIMEKLAPHMRKYARLLQKLHNLDTMTYADLKLPLDPEYTPRVSIEGSREYIEKGLSIMGEDYVDMIREAYRDRWVDFAQNQGKSTGGFCCSPYGKGSFILLSWNERMSDVMTLAHELGHAGHFRSCNACQSIYDTDVSTYFVEAPSTMNEILMAHYLLKTNTDKRFRRWVLSNMISNTYYHNFVTHLLEAAYQREVYKIVDAGGSVSAEVLNNIMKSTLKQFWGDAVELNDGAELTWMRQPHYYMGLYSYTYSAGLTVATQACSRIETEGQPSVEDWKKVLAAGSTLDPIGLAALAKIDITTDAPLLDTIAYIGSVIDEICALTDELEHTV